MTDRERLLKAFNSAEVQNCVDVTFADNDDLFNSPTGNELNCSVEYLADYLLQNGKKFGIIMMPDLEYMQDLFVIHFDSIIKVHVIGFQIRLDKNSDLLINLERAGLFFGSIKADKIGKTAFLTIEDAQEALENIKRNEDLKNE